MNYIAALIVSLIITILIIQLLSRFSGRLRLFDLPDARKIHKVSIPRIGGIGMVIGTLLSLLLFAVHDQQTIAIMAATAMLFVFCVADDRGDLDYRMKFLGQILAALIVIVFGDIRVDIVPFMGLDPVPLWFSMPLTLIVIVGITNAINLSDGLDGLASGLVMLSLAGIGLLAHIGGGEEVLVMVLAIAGAILGFLRYNTYPASIFMGDTGSQFLGFFVGVLSIILTQKVVTALNPAIPLLLFGIPIFDTAFVILKRIHKKRSLFVADKNHIHHQLLALNFDHYEAVSIIYLVQALLVSVGVSMRYQSDIQVVLLWFLLNAIFATVLVAAGHAGWRAHNQVNYKSFMALALQALRNGQFVKRAPQTVSSSGVALLFLLGPFMVGNVSTDIGYLSMVLGAALFVRITLEGHFWFLSLRLLLYVGVAVIIYLVSKYPAQNFTIPVILEYLYFGVIVLFLFLGARYATSDTFKITPTDVLILILLIGLALAQRASVVDELLASVVIKIVVMFFAVEYVLKGMSGRGYLVTVPPLLAMAVLAFKGIFAI